MLPAQKTAQRIADLEAKLAARTQNGQPIRGYGENVRAIQAELARLRGGSSAAGESQESAGDVSP